MPKFDVELIDQESGTKKTLLIEAVDADDVRQTAERMGYALGSVAPSRPAAKARASANNEESEEGGVDLAAGCRACGLAIAVLGVVLIGWFTIIQTDHAIDQGSPRFVGVLIGAMLIVIGSAGCFAARVVARR